MVLGIYLLILGLLIAGAGAYAWQFYSPFSLGIAGMIVGGSVDGVLCGYEGHFSEPIYQALYGGDLTFEIARNALLNRRWDASATIDDRATTLKEVIEGAQFHKLVEELKQL